MKKNRLDLVIQFFALVVITSLILGSCSYEDFVENEFEFTSVYLPKPQIDRSFIIGEGMQIGVGVVLGGRLSNTEDVEVTFSLQDTIVTNSGLTVLPNNYYELVDANGNPANNTITIPVGSIQGFVYVKADSLSILQDPLSLGNSYALGFHLDNVVRADSILTDFQSSMITFTYINQLYGNYFQNGQYVKTDLSDNSQETVTYSGVITDALELTMVSPNTVLCSGLADLRGGSNSMNINLNSDNSLSLSTSDAGIITIIDDGDSFYNPETRDIVLNYSFEFNGFSYKATDTLTFRNRVVDGVNQIGL